MLTVTPCAVLAQHEHVSVAAASLAATNSSNGPNDLLSAVAVIVAVMLLGFALQSLRSLLAALWSMTRMVFSAVGVAVLLVAAVAVLIGALVVSAVDH